jgi:hypothetical protein
MAGERAVVKVLVNTPDNKEITSPVMARDEAERDAKTIDEARRDTTEIDLPWLKIYGGLIVGLYLENRASSRAQGL